MEVQLAFHDDDTTAISLWQFGQAVEGAGTAARRAPEDLAIAEGTELVVEEPAGGIDPPGGIKETDLTAGIAGAISLRRADSRFTRRRTRATDASEGKRISGCSS